MPMRFIPGDVRMSCHAGYARRRRRRVVGGTQVMQQVDTRQKLDRIANTSISRRRAVQGAAALGIAGPELSLGLAGNAAAQEDRPVLRFGSSEADIQTLDPHLASGTQDRTVVDMVFNGLVRYKPGTVTELEPDIAAEMPT